VILKNDRIFKTSNERRTRNNVSRAICKYIWHTILKKESKYSVNENRIMAKGFQKGNTEGKKTKGRVGIRKKMYKEVSEQLIALSPTYNECLSRQINGEPLPEPTKEGMDRFEKMYEFARPKLARQEVSGLGGAAIEHKLNFDDEQLSNISAAAAALSSRLGKK
jgi:hypothetical protein